MKKRGRITLDLRGGRRCAYILTAVWLFGVLVAGWIDVMAADPGFLGTTVAISGFSLIAACLT